MFSTTQKHKIDRIPMEIIEDKNNYTVLLEVPGIQKENIDISFDGNMLFIKTEKQEISKEGEEKIFQEFRYGTSFRAIDLPSDANFNKTKAELKDGILKIKINKKENKKTKIEIKQI